MDCDICGKTGELYRAIVEDVELNVCNPCSTLGKVIEKISIPFKKLKYNKTEEPKPEEMEVIVEGYSDLIKKTRGSLGMTQKEFAKKIREKESIVHKIETGAIRPSIQMARKLERILKIRLIDPYVELHESKERSSKYEVTIGDLIKVKHRR